LQLLLLLDSNETGGLIVMNVIWSHFLFGTHRRQHHNRRCMWQKAGGSEAWKPWSLKSGGLEPIAALQKFTPMHRDWLRFPTSIPKYV